MIDLPIGGTITITGASAISGDIDRIDEIYESLFVDSTILSVDPPAASPDLAIPPDSLKVDLSQGTVDVGYQVANAALTQPASLGHYWADDSGTKIGSTPLVHSDIPSGTAINASRLPTYRFTDTQLDNIPYNATQLTAVVSGGGDSNPSNNVQTVKIPLAWGGESSHISAF